MGQTLIDMKTDWAAACCSACLVLLGLLFTASARAGDEQTARAAFERGVAASEAGDWQRARAEFQASLAEASKASTLFNLAFAEVKLGLAEQALATLDAFDRSAQPALHGALIAQARELRLTAEASAARTRIGALEQALAEQQRARALAEQHSASPPPGAPTSAATAVVAQPAAHDAAATRGAEPPHQRAGTGWALIGIGTALAAGGVAVGLTWWRDRADSLDRCDQMEGMQCPERAQIARQLHGAQATTVVLSASGLALLSAGAVWVALRSRASRPAVRGLGLSFGALGVSARTSF